ncbi:hypothetical protein NHQ30_005445 [Ciborinia camelliae]|nr:hypothetical protein NHQ30_005445 [Ciborinia camelliae]
MNTIRNAGHYVSEKTQAGGKETSKEVHKRKGRVPQGGCQTLTAKAADLGMEGTLMRDAMVDA